MPSKILHLRPLGRAILACLPIAGASTSADAQPTAPAGVETIIVTDRAVRREIELSPGGVTLVDGNALKERNVSSLADLLRYTPGVWAESAAGTDVMRFSSRGSNLDATDYDMNGIELLQDGLPVTTADGNNHNRVMDPLSARFATIARGANALKYGASNLGGAIDFVSPTARNSDPFEAYFGGGSNGQRLARGTVGSVFGEHLDGLLTVETKRWEGFRDHNEQERAGLYANAGWRPSDRTESRFFLTYVNNDQELPGSLTRAELERDPRQANASAVTGNYQVNVETRRLANKTAFRLDADRRLEFGLSLEEQSLYHPIVDVRVDFDGAGPDAPVQVFGLLIDTDHTEAGGMLRYGQRLGSHDLLFGVNYARGKTEGGNYWNDGGQVGSLMTAVDHHATSLEVYALDRWQVTDRALVEFGAQAVAAERNVVNIDAATGSVRALRDDFSRVNPRVGVIYSVWDSVDLFANVSGLYEPPTNFELEDEASGGSRILEAMSGTVVEMGARGRRRVGTGTQLSWEVALYYAAVDNEILSRDDPGAPGTSLSVNIDDTTHAGVEALFAAAFPVGRHGATLAPQVSLTVNEFSFDGDAIYGNNRLPSAPGYVLRGELLYRAPNGFYAGPTFDVVDDRFADFANTYRVDSYSIFGVRTGWSNDRWNVFGELVNAADEDYVATVLVRDIAAANAAVLNPGVPRSLYFGVSGRF